MKKEFLEMLNLKEQADKLIEKINQNTAEIALAIRKDKTVLFQNMKKDLEEVEAFMSKFKLSCVELHTNVESTFYCEYLIGICILKGRILINAYHKNGQCIAYEEQWNLFKKDMFPISIDGTMSGYNRDLDILMSNWDKVYPEIEKELLVKCNKVLCKKMEEANSINEKVNENR